MNSDLKSENEIQNKVVLSQCDDKHGKLLLRKKLTHCCVLLKKKKFIIFVF